MNVMYADRLIPVKLVNEVRTDIALTNSAMLELMVTKDNKKKSRIIKTYG